MEKLILNKSYWVQKRETVKNSYDIDGNWLEIIEKFKQRIENYYFNPIEIVKEPQTLNGEGFSILTIQCALIEMFAGFKFGKIHKYNKNATDPNYTYKNAADCFFPFLYSEEIFENHFHKFENGNKINDEPYSATDFYNKVRCGLMHEARTKGEWVINAKKSYQGDEIIFITMDKTNNLISIDRTILNKQLRKYFQAYLNNLSANTIEGCRLRRFLARKIDHLYDISADINFDWWNDN